MCEDEFSNGKNRQICTRHGGTKHQDLRPPGEPAGRFIHVQFFYGFAVGDS